ncbi:MAG: peptide chain release factor 1 [Oscillospiraceae bacterium]
MEDRLNQIAERLRQVERELADPAVYSDQQRLKNLSREQKELTPVVENFTALQQTEQAIAEAREMLSDPELRELAQEELTRTKEQRERLAEELKRLLLPRDPNDEKSVVLEIRGGVGGEEGALFAADLLRMYTMYAERRGWQLEIVSQNVTELGGVRRSATVEGDGAWSRLKFEAGTHRVQRVPETESGGRIQTSAATVAVMPEAEETELSIDPKDLQIDTFRSSGAGGQHVNKTESAIRITHLPSGTVVECQDERSQYKNKDRAMKILRSKLYEAEQARQNAEIAATRRSQVGTGDRSGKIRTYNFPQNRVTDHRLTGDSKNFNLAAVINGDLDALIDALTLADQTRRLQEGYEKGE